MFGPIDVVRLDAGGRYRVEGVLRDGAPRIRTMLVVADTGNIPSLLATPI